MGRIVPENRVWEVVVSGGPCGGKTTFMNVAAQKLRELGWRVLVLPELATIYISGGVQDIVDLAENRHEQYLAFQQELLRQEYARRQDYLAMARALGGKVILLRDRGFSFDLKIATFG